jgi:hypothetical protein
MIKYITASILAMKCSFVMAGAYHQCQVYDFYTPNPIKNPKHLILEFAKQSNTAIIGDTGAHYKMVPQSNLTIFKQLVEPMTKSYKMTLKDKQILLDNMKSSFKDIQVNGIYSNGDQILGVLSCHKKITPDNLLLSQGT